MGRTNSELLEAQAATASSAWTLGLSLQHANRRAKHDVAGWSHHDIGAGLAPGLPPSWYFAFRLLPNIPPWNAFLTRGPLLNPIRVVPSHCTP